MISSYVLNPDLAIPTIVSEHDIRKYGGIYDLPYHTVQFNLDAINPKHIDNIKDIRYPYHGLIYSEFSKLMKPFLELLSWGQPVQRILRYKYYKIRKVIDSITWQNLSTVRKQYYIPTESLASERYKVGNLYANLTIPPRGCYGTLHYDARAKNIKVNSQTSIIPAGCARTLVRLRDGSLMELYGLKYNPDDHPGEVKLLYMILDKLVMIEPTITKRYVFSLALTNELLRPAYRFNLLLIKGILEL